MTSIAFYIENQNSQPDNTLVYQALNQAVEEGYVTDANLFYNNIDYNPTHCKFGIFNSSDIWHYTGNLVTTSLENLVTAASSVNKFKLCYLFDSKQNNNLLSLLGSIKYPTIATDEDSSKEYYRLTGNKPVLIEDLNVKKILEVLE